LVYDSDRCPEGGACWEIKVRFRSRISIALLLAASSISLAPMARGQQGCEIDEAQRLFGQQPRPNATIEPLLKACVAAGATDYRVYMFLGVMARDAGDRERAIGYLKKAHELDPAAPNPALELGFTLEEKHASTTRAGSTRGWCRPTPRMRKR